MAVNNVLIKGSKRYKHEIEFESAQNNLKVSHNVDKLGVHTYIHIYTYIYIHNICIYIIYIYIYILSIGSSSAHEEIVFVCITGIYYTLFYNAHTHKRTQTHTNTRTRRKTYAVTHAPGGAGRAGLRTRVTAICVYKKDASENLREQYADALIYTYTHIRIHIHIRKYK